MTAILALDTSTPACSVALIQDGVVLEDFRLAPRQHNDLILPMVEQILAQAQLSLTQLDAIAFGRGPGSFTGLRISAGVVQGLAYGADLPVVPVSTLAAMALEAQQKTYHDTWLSALDARMGEVYIGGYQITEQDGFVVANELLSERVIVPDNLDPIDGPYQGVGSGWLYQDTLNAKLEQPATTILEEIAPRAACIAQLAQWPFSQAKVVTAEQALPVYLRDEITWEKQPAKIGKR
ncbi:tRNA (adenosine(37)-N6)-threonylcarbamoyltransferase complex dimerization subunit type 1 TsaB [Marinomonas ostreistagni]|uniref:tRNA (adenosine(37)-N6)-threonylcarbamoyltransferase complex dimerization subunit type 1 TsaB n=1 Tax=Marinomonas ostreistagni TaxID=359209 RepID=UPI001950EF2B|nr:tRNA (adenosine(37)-N6)-threonylcarbamoyltransferase complex dimerization subunit type 1 TsaB [Marinomonas ostreistagni]MBM6551646.1 tRNA (adenosine(37)-N6)-threonylcarbamoyltransferase complex dimerization subunit type 1 TsaB [Marinomonas ostreistagni]